MTIYLYNRTMCTPKESKSNRPTKEKKRGKQGKLIMAKKNT